MQDKEVDITTLDDDDDTIEDQQKRKINILEEELNNTHTLCQSIQSQLTNYQQALNLSEIQKQQLINENEILKLKLTELGVDVDDFIGENGSGGVGVIGEVVQLGEVLPVGATTTTGSSTNDPIMNSDDHHEEDDDDDDDTNNDPNNDSTNDNSVVVTNAVAAALGDHTNTSLDISTAEAEALAAVDAHHLHSTTNTSTTTVPITTATNTTTTTSSTTHLSSRSDEKWDMHYQRLIEYKNMNGNCLVPTSTELGRWICRQRHNHRYKGLKEDRKIRLLELDPTCLGDERLDTQNQYNTFDNEDNNNNNNNTLNEGGGGGEDNDSTTNNNITSPKTPNIIMKTKYNMAYESKLHAKWEIYFQQLIEYKTQHGHCNFPTMNGSLGRWISRQRTLYRSQKLKSDRYEKLKSIDFIFEDATPLEFKNKLDLQWDTMYNQLTEHKERAGHCFDVPEEMPLGKWLYRQRWLYKNGNLREDRAKKLLDIGFEDKKVLKKNADGGGGTSGRKRKRKRMSEGGDDGLLDQSEVGGGEEEEEEGGTSTEVDKGQNGDDAGISFDQIIEDGTDKEATETTEV